MLTPCARRYHPPPPFLHMWCSYTFVRSLLSIGSITVRVVSRPDVYFADGNSTSNFTTKVIGAPKESSYVSSSTFKQDMDFTYFHCEEANFWNVSFQSDGGNASCVLCTDIVDDNTKVFCARPCLLIYTIYVCVC